MPKSLWTHWKALAAAQSPHAIALREPASNRSWSFAELTAEAEARRPEWRGKGLALISRRGPDFIIDLLSAWAEGLTVCPLEDGQSPIESITPLPHKNWALLKLTSGSTGNPRGVAFTSAALRADEKQITQTMGLRREWANLGAISLAHSYGFSNLVLPLILRGIPLVLCPSPLPESLRHALRHSGPCVLPGVPALWRMWFSAGVITPDIQLAISAGAPLPLALEKEIYEQTKLKVHNFLGATECGGIAYDQTDIPRTEENFVGTAMHGVRFFVDDHDALIVQSPALAETYWPPSPDSIEISQLTPHGFRTGDLAQISDDGLRLIGRASDLMNLAGRKVHPAEIEAHLRKHPAVAECIAFSVPSPDPHRHEDMVMGWRTQPGQTVAVQDLARWMAEIFPTWKCPRTWCHWPDLSPDARGKISRHAWKTRYLSESQ